MDESARLNAAEALDLPSIRSPDAFAAIATLTARMLRCPVAAITVVERDCNQFLSEPGLGLPQTPREGSFCSVCIDQGEPLIVSDAFSDPRFRGHELVAKPPRLRSYLGVPLELKDGLTPPTQFTALSRSLTWGGIQSAQSSVLISEHDWRRRQMRKLETNRRR